MVQCFKMPCKCTCGNCNDCCQPDTRSSIIQAPPCSNANYIATAACACGVCSACVAVTHSNPLLCIPPVTLCAYVAGKNNCCCFESHCTCQKTQEKNNNNHLLQVDKILADIIKSIQKEEPLNTANEIIKNKHGREIFHKHANIVLNNTSCNISIETLYARLYRATKVVTSQPRTY
jgi:uncharacterized membrane protein